MIDLVLFSMTVEERFWSKVKKTSGCWLWMGARFKGSKNEPRYGMFAVDRKPVKAHRFSYQLHFGPIPNEAKVLHSCDNPPCVKPGHLFLGSCKANSQDMVAKKRSWKARGYPSPHFGETSPIAKLTENDVIAIRSSTISQRQLAGVHGVSRRTIRHVLARSTWRHI